MVLRGLGCLGILGCTVARTDADSLVRFIWNNPAISFRMHRNKFRLTYSLAKSTIANSAPFATCQKSPPAKSVACTRNRACSGQGVWRCQTAISDSALTSGIFSVARNWLLVAGHVSRRLPHSVQPEILMLGFSALLIIPKIVVYGFT